MTMTLCVFVNRRAKKTCRAPIHKRVRKNTNQTKKQQSERKKSTFAHTNLPRSTTPSAARLLFWLLLLLLLKLFITPIEYFVMNAPRDIMQYFKLSNFVHFVAAAVRLNGCSSLYCRALNQARKNTVNLSISTKFPSVKSQHNFNGSIWSIFGPKFVE